MIMKGIPIDVVLDESEFSDFGSDVEELSILEDLVSQVDADIEDVSYLPLPKVAGLETRAEQDICYDTEKQRPARSESTKSPEPLDRTVPDDRSPLDRFRKPPKKAFSVTDLVSPAWCELQFYYSLVEPRRKKRTAAMKQGSAVHQALEDEVHTTVPIVVEKREDRFGLRVWNIIQGLRTLRDTGRTRELEVWGTVGGEIVNGIIDELSYECPDPTHENKPTEDILPEYQTSITEYLTSQHGGTAASKKEDEEKKIYISDVKTRGSPTLPTGSSIRPTILQLHLYHHLLENMVMGNLNLSQLAERYKLNVDEVFSDQFISQLGSLNQDLSRVATIQDQPDQLQQVMSSQDSLTTIVNHNNLSSLWSLMMSEFQHTFLIRSQSEYSSISQSLSDTSGSLETTTRLSPLLTVEYLAPTYKHVTGTNKKSIGKKSFGFNPTYLKQYLEDSLAWWHGERKARGVELQEAWKCRSCDFRDDCSWIHERDSAALAEVLERKRLRESAGLESSGINRSKV